MEDEMTLEMKKYFRKFKIDLDPVRQKQNDKIKLFIQSNPKLDPVIGKFGSDPEESLRFYLYNSENDQLAQHLINDYVITPQFIKQLPKDEIDRFIKYTGKNYLYFVHEHTIPERDDEQLELADKRVFVANYLYDNELLRLPLGYIQSRRWSNQKHYELMDRLLQYMQGKLKVDQIESYQQTQGIHPNLIGRVVSDKNVDEWLSKLSAVMKEFPDEPLFQKLQKGMQIGPYDIKSLNNESKFQFAEAMFNKKRRSDYNKYERKTLIVSVDLFIVYLLQQKGVIPYDKHIDWQHVHPFHNMLAWQQFGYLNMQQYVNYMMKIIKKPETIERFKAVEWDDLINKKPIDQISFKTKSDKLSGNIQETSKVNISDPGTEETVSISSKQNSFGDQLSSYKKGGSEGSIHEVQLIQPNDQSMVYSEIPLIEQSNIFSQSGSYYKRSNKGSEESKEQKGNSAETSRFVSSSSSNKQSNVNSVMLLDDASKHKVRLGTNRNEQQDYLAQLYEDQERERLQQFQSDTDLLDETNRSQSVYRNDVAYELYEPIMNIGSLSDKVRELNNSLGVTIQHKQKEYKSDDNKIQYEQMIRRRNDYTPGKTSNQSGAVSIKSSSVYESEPVQPKPKSDIIADRMPDLEAHSNRNISNLHESEMFGKSSKKESKISRMIERAGGSESYRSKTPDKSVNQKMKAKGVPDELRKTIKFIYNKTENPDNHLKILKDIDDLSIAQLEHKYGRYTDYYKTSMRNLQEDIQLLKHLKSQFLKNQLVQRESPVTTHQPVQKKKVGRPKKQQI